MPEQPATWWTCPTGFGGAPKPRPGFWQTTGHTHQFVCDLLGSLLHISDPLPGNTHDAKGLFAVLSGLLSVRACMRVLGW